ncbi:MAG: hypothetical protein OXC19_25385 [Bryobacterales bacterium]|nr:hypothetical protein [Bryobacterales bacterium]
MKRKTVLVPREIVIPPSDYKPTKAELEEEIAPPVGSMEENLRRLFRPVKVVRRRPTK